MDDWPEVAAVAQAGEWQVGVWSTPAAAATGHGIGAHPAGVESRCRGLAEIPGHRRDHGNERDTGLRQLRNNAAGGTKILPRLRSARRRCLTAACSAPADTAPVRESRLPKTPVAGR